MTRSGSALPTGGPRGDCLRQARARSRPNSRSVRPGPLESRRMPRPWPRGPIMRGHRPGQVPEERRHRSPVSWLPRT